MKRKLLLRTFMDNKVDPPMKQELQAEVLEKKNNSLLLHYVEADTHLDTLLSITADKVIIDRTKNGGSKLVFDRNEKTSTTMSVTEDIQVDLDVATHRLNLMEECVELEYKLFLSGKELMQNYLKIEWKTLL